VKKICLLLMAPMIVASAGVLADELGPGRDAKQAELDAACYVALKNKLIVVWAELIEECVATEQLRDRATCERFYVDYGESTANQAPLFYDLPECEKAHEYRGSYRSSGN
jgi:hypothetical protein